MRKLPDFGAIVISLDFAIHWGVRYRYPADGTYAASLAGVRRVIREMLRVFEELNVAATWATPPAPMINTFSLNVCSSMGVTTGWTRSRRR